MENKLPSKSSKIFKETGEDLEMIYNLIYSDCLYKERLCENNDKLDLLPDYDLGRLTLILLHTESFYNNYMNLSLEYLLNYYSQLGVINLILVVKKEEICLINRYRHLFDNFTLIVNDNQFKSELINEAVKKVNTQHILVCDDNCLISEDNFNKSVSLLKYYDFIFPSDRSYYKINQLDSLSKFDINGLCTEKKQYLNHEYLYLFCKKDSLKKIGCCNSKLKSEHIISEELNLRINYSGYPVKHMSDSLYLFGFLESTDNTDDEKILIQQMNLSKLDDFSILLNHNRDMFYYSNKDFYKNHYTYPRNYLISVIIPVYNCEDFYLDRCINSLKQQTIGFENIEIIIIDDKSTFNESRERIINYSKAYKNIKAYFLERNMGAGIARNIGISKVTSDYILFLDHDDYYLKYFCENAYNYLKNWDIDIFIADHINLSSNYSSNFEILKLEDGEELMESFNDDLGVLFLDPTIWSKGYRKDFLLKNNLLFPEYRTAEDNLFNIKTLFKAKGIYIKNIVSTIYELRQADTHYMRSTSLNITKKSLITKIKSYKEIFALFKEYAPDETSKKLNVMKYWIEQQLLESQLYYKDFKDLMEESRPLFKMILNDGNNQITKKYGKLTESVVAEDYEKAYDIYLKLKMGRLILTYNSAN